MVAKTKHLFAVHDWDTTWAALVKGAAKTAWCIVTEEIGDDPNNVSGRDYRYMAEYGVAPIVRLNYSHHGKGTIPTPDRYDEFAVRCANFVRNSQGCVMWIIGNEPNITGERPVKQIPIQPADYIRCYKMCYSAIKQVSIDHRVAIAPVAPYNEETGWCVVYWRDMLDELGKQGTTTDFLPLHTYSRGGDPNSVFSNDKMNWPYDNYYNGFRAYQDFLRAVPHGLRHLRAYITETDQLTPWADRNSGWVVNAYKEIDNWNKQQGTIKIDCLALYRWPKFDQWWIVGKNGVLEDFKKALAIDFSIVGGHVISLPVIISGPSAKITAPAGVNVRSGPSVSHAILGALPQNDIVPVLGQSSDKQWWSIQSPWGQGWVYAPLVETNNANNAPIVVSPPPPAPTAPQKLDRDWLVGALSRVLGIEIKVAMAVLAIESAGRSFEGNQMIIRFENHVFHDEIARLDPQKKAQVGSSFRFGTPRWTGHQWLNPATNRWEAQHDGGQAEEWATFNFARKINETAAMRSISMGSAQILGSNHQAVGYPTVQEMFHAYNDRNLGEYNQVTGFFAYLVSANLVDRAKRKDWRGFAASYNGSGNVDYYANAMRQKYLELGGKA